MNGLNPFLQVVTPDGYKKCHQVIQKASIILKVVVVVLNPVSNGIQNPKTVMVNIQDIHMLYMKQKLFLLRNSSVTLHYNTMAQATSDILKLYHIKNSHVHMYVRSISDLLDSQWCTKSTCIRCARLPLDSSDAQSFKPLSTHLQ